MNFEFLLINVQNIIHKIIKNNNMYSLFTVYKYQ